MGALDFDPEAVLADIRLKRGSKAAKPAANFSSFSNFSRGPRSRSEPTEGGGSEPTGTIDPSRSAGLEHPSPPEGDAGQHSRLKLDRLTSAESLDAVLGKTQNREEPPAKLAKVAKVAVCRVSSIDLDAFEERAALVEFGAGVPREWAEGFARLDTATPLPGFGLSRWRTLIEDGASFLDRWACEVARLGWPAESFFGVDPAAQSASLEPAGLLFLIQGGRVTAITVDSATILRPSGARLTYRREISDTGQPLWHLLGDQDAAVASPC